MFLQWWDVCYKVNTVFVNKTSILIIWHVTGQSGAGISCCREGVPLEPQFRHPDCFHIDIPKTDKTYSPFGERCMEFVRSLPAPRPECNFGPREQVRLGLLNLKSPSYDFYSILRTSVCTDMTLSTNNKNYRSLMTTMNFVSTHPHQNTQYN